MKAKRVWSRGYLAKAYGSPHWATSWRFFVEVDTPAGDEPGYAYVENYAEDVLSNNVWTYSKFKAAFHAASSQEWEFWHNVIRGTIAPDIYDETRDIATKEQPLCHCDITKLWNGTGHDSTCPEGRRDN